MYVINRKKVREPLDPRRIHDRIAKLSYGLHHTVQASDLASHIVDQLTNNCTTTQLDEATAEAAAFRASIHPDYSILASRVVVSSLHKNTLDSFADTMTVLSHNVDRLGQPCPLIDPKLLEVVMKHRDRLDRAICYQRDFDNYDYFGIKTLENGYLKSVGSQTMERPQHMLMRVAMGIHHDDINSVVESYDLMSEGYFTHASPTLFNAGTPKPQLASCFLLTMKQDSIDGIFDTLKQCAKISQCAGGIGLDIQKTRSLGSYIRGTNGESNGIIPMLRVYNETAKYVNQGGKRKGSFAMYLEPWHPEILSFLDIRKNFGKEHLRARDLFTAIWMPDLFMKRLEKNGSWSVFDPSECPELEKTVGEEFERYYEYYENQPGKVRRTVPCVDIWEAILTSQIETGTPYMLYKDSINRKSNYKHYEIIKSSNLCAEIVEPATEDEVAVCNLASIALPKFVKGGVFDFDKLVEVTKVVTRNLNKVIDVTYYPIVEARTSNMRHRPIGIGIQGLADLFNILRYPFESSEAAQLNRDIAETMYFAALTASNELAKIHGPYEKYAGSPASRGELQFDMWEVTPSKRWDWAGLKQSIQQYGLRNAKLIALMPTASTSQILGNSECFEPYTANIYSRKTLSGNHPVINKFLIKDLLELNLWNPQMKNEIIRNKGSVQDIPSIPDHLKRLYKTVWDIPQRVVIDMAADRGAFVDQSQSMNIYLRDATMDRLSSMHMYGWKKGLKTGMYYLRTRPAADAIQFTVEQEKAQPVSDALGDSNNALDGDDNINGDDASVCPYRPKGMANDEECAACGA